ncbi:uncharacterized protein CTRU02_215655 [Colletotrichum truncatum]|uniref:Uncharacterized protein n=1 Tax=Colletotrichum truncatum TaxID=5467 RepID=A0ACC3YCC3_COLTU|nr:uncharacterized protein CTRU02_05407 [Colletotrichum truncatum]KAF6793850.1 hypothetical protein CTRU02_05407 [Colletotrichum truncatum]
MFSDIECRNRQWRLGYVRIFLLIIYAAALLKTYLRDVSGAYRSAAVTGIDISPIMPQEVLPNVRFEIDDFNEPWTFKPNSFDYIHIRFLTGSIKDWESIVEQAYHCLEPGGILESSEPSFLVERDDGTVNEKSAWSGWYNIFEQYG